MLKKIGLALAFMGASFAAQAADDVHYFNFNQAVQNAVAAGALDGTVKFYLAGTKSGGQILQANMISNKKTNGFNKSAEEGCDWAIRSALIQFERAAKARGGNAVTNIVSFYDRQVYQDTEKYECRDGTFATGVVLRGDIAKF